MQWIIGVVYAGFLAGTGALALIDARTRRLPNRIVFPLYIWGAAGLTLCSWFGHSWLRLVAAGLAMAVLYGLFWLFWFFGPMGFGDVKLVGVIGLFLGWAGIPFLVAGLLFGMIGATVLALALVAAGRLTFRSTMAYGPCLIAGSWAGLGFALAR